MRTSSLATSLSEKVKAVVAPVASICWPGWASPTATSAAGGATSLSLMVAAATESVIASDVPLVAECRRLDLQREAFQRFDRAVVEQVDYNRRVGGAGGNRRLRRGLTDENPSRPRRCH